MIDIKRLRENPKYYEQSSKEKRVDADIASILTHDAKNTKFLNEIGELRSALKTQSKNKPTPDEIKTLKKLSEKIKAIESKQKEVQEKLNKLLLTVPNPAADDVPRGKTENDNVVVETRGKVPKFDFPIKNYMELGEALDVIDVQRAAKVSGSRFGYLKNEAALLEFALVQYAWDLLIFKEGFTPVIPPVLIKEQSMRAMGYLEHGGEDETYHFKEDGLYFVGTSEQSLGPYHMDEIIPESDLPKRYTAFSSCFRREAGSYGKDTKGILRVHQFDKIEMYVFCTPNKSKQEHENILSLEKTLMDGLGLHYRVVNLCTADLGKPAVKTYDIETWMPSQNTYRETHSTSNTTDYQARRLNSRYKDAKTGTNHTIHTLNGTAFAIGRMIIMILENFQQKDGTVLIPQPLQKYMNGKKFIGK